MSPPSRPRAKRRRRATGIYEDAYGFAIVVGGKEHRGWPRGTPLDELREERKDLLRTHLEQRRGMTRGTLAAAVAQYLAGIPDGPHRRDERALLRHWLAVFGDRPLGAITASDIRAQLAAWQTTHLPVPRRGRGPDAVHTRPRPATLKHLRRALSAVYRAMHGAGGANPVRDVPAPRIRYDDARAVPRAIVEAIFAELPDRGRPIDGPTTGVTRGKHRRPTVSFTKLRLRAIAETGWPPAMLKLLRPDMVDLDGATAIRPARMKGRGVPPKRVAITPEAVDALRALFASGAPRAFSSSSMGTTWARAVAKARARWQRERPGEPWTVPDGVRAYDLRHTFATEFLAASGDLTAVGEVLGHASHDTTRRYSLGALSVRSQLGVAALTAARAAQAAAATKTATMTSGPAAPQSSAKRPRVTAQRPRASQRKGGGKR